MMVTVPRTVTTIKKIMVIIWAHSKMLRQVSENMIMVHPQMTMKMRRSAKTMRRAHKMVKAVVLVRVRRLCQKRSDEKSF